MYSSKRIVFQRIHRRHTPLLKRTSTVLAAAMILHGIPLVPAYVYAEGNKSSNRIAAGGKPGFGQTAMRGAFTIKAVKESGEFGGALTPTSEDLDHFSTAGNEAFGACMTLWNKHRWADAEAAMNSFVKEHPEDPWVGEAELHMACNEKYNHEYAAAEARLVRLYESNKKNAVGRKALIRLGHLYFQSFRYQKSEEVFQTLLISNPIEEEVSYAINWLFHIRRAWALAALNRECGPQSFGYAAWLIDHMDEVSKCRSAEKTRRLKSSNYSEGLAYLPPVSLSRVYEKYEWSSEKGDAEGVSLSSMRALLLSNGWELKVRKASFPDLIYSVSEEHPAILCIPAPAEALFSAPEPVTDASERKAEELSRNGGYYDLDTGHYVVLVKATEKGGWILDSIQGLIWWPAQRIKEMWAFKNEKGIVAWLERSGQSIHPRLENRKGISASEELNFKGGCCGTPQQNDDVGCETEGYFSGASGSGFSPTFSFSSSGYGMPEHGVNIYNLNYLIKDTPLWLQTPLGPDLELTLTYNNRESNNGRYPIEDVQFYPFGFRWSGPYDGRYYYEPGDRYLVRFPNGMEVYFDNQGSGTYLPESRYLEHFDFSILPDGTIKVSVRKGMRAYYFHPLNTAMQQTLSRIEDRYGNGIDITRDGDTNSATYGCLLEVRSDTCDSAFKYEYNASGNVTNVYETCSSGGQDISTDRNASFTYEIVGTNGNARLKTMTDMGGYTTSFEYGSQTYVASANGQSVESDHHVISYTWPNNGTWRFDLQQMHKLDFDEPLMLSVEDPEGGIKKYYYQAPYAYGPFTSEDRNGIGSVKSLGTTGLTTTHDFLQIVNNDNIHDVNGDMLNCKEMAANGQDLLSFRQLLEPVSASPYNSSATAYSASANAARVDNWYSYTSLTNGHRIVTLTNETFETSGLKQPTASWIETFEQDENLDVIRTVDRAGNTVLMDRTNRLINAVRICPSGGSTQTVYEATYNDNGQLLTYTTDEALQNVVSNVYDSVGLLKRAIYPDSTTEGFNYDPYTLFMTDFTNRTGKVTSVLPDDMGRPLTIDYPDGTSETMTYGCCAADSIQDRYGVTSNYGYDGNKQLEWAVVPMNDDVDTHLAFDYLGEGELSSLGYGPSDDELAIRTFGYVHENGRTRQESRTTPEGKAPKTWSYYFAGLPRTVTDGRGVVTTYEWVQGKGLLTKKTVDGSAASLETVVVDYTYDAQDRLTNVVKNVSGLGNIWSETYGYDNRSRIESIGTVVANIPGQTANLEYSVEYAYGDRGYVTNRTVSVSGSNTASTAYSYDLESARITQVADDFATVNYGYDQYGRLQFQTNKVNGVSASQTVKTWDYDDYSKLSSLSISNSSSLLWGSCYGYDVERITSITNSVDDSRWQYGYDYQAQLTHAYLYSPSNTIAHAEQYRYDAVGNMTHKAISGNDADIAMLNNADDEISEYKRHKTVTMIGTVSDTNATLSLPLADAEVVQDDYGYWIAPSVPVHPMSNGTVAIQLKAEASGQNDTFKLAEFEVFPTSTNLSYDANGSLLMLPGETSNDPPYTLNWNSEGRLASAVSTTATNNYYYDDNNRRIAKKENGELTLYLWDGKDNLGIGDHGGNITEYYTRGLGIVGDVGTLAAAHSFRGSITCLLHSNHRGDVVLATDHFGTAVYQAKYAPYGNRLSASGAYSPRVGFSSKERDITGLVYYGYRYYAPLVCQWISLDPLGELGGLNLYRFCGNSPINFVDLDGMKQIYTSCTYERASDALKAALEDAQKRTVKCHEDPCKRNEHGGHVYENKCGRYFYIITIGSNKYVNKGSRNFDTNRGIVSFHAHPINDGGFSRGAVDSDEAAFAAANRLWYKLRWRKPLDDFLILPNGDVFLHKGGDQPSNWNKVGNMGCQE